MAESGWVTLIAPWIGSWPGRENDKMLEGSCSCMLQQPWMHNCAVEGPLEGEDTSTEPSMAAGARIFPGRMAEEVGQELVKPE